MIFSPARERETLCTQRVHKFYGGEGGAKSAGKTLISSMNTGSNCGAFVHLCPPGLKSGFPPVKKPLNISVLPSPR
jgi:hypothetical protein